MKNNKDRSISPEETPTFHRVVMTYIYLDEINNNLILARFDLKNTVPIF